MPEDIKAAISDFINDMPISLVIASLVVASLVVASLVALGVLATSAIIAAAKIIDAVITAIQYSLEILRKEWQIAISMCNSIKNAILNFGKWVRDVWNRAGITYAAANPYFSVDTVKLRSYANRITDVNNRLKNLDSALHRVFWEVSPLDMLKFAWINILTSGSPTLIQIKMYLSESAERFDTAENKARSYVGG